jgi:hypothetical protein
LTALVTGTCAAMVTAHATQFAEALLFAPAFGAVAWALLTHRRADRPTRRRTHEHRPHHR